MKKSSFQVVRIRPESMKVASYIRIVKTKINISSVNDSEKNEGGIFLDQYQSFLLVRCLNAE